MTSRATHPLTTCATHLVERRTDLERAAKHAVVLADEYRRTGDTEAAARLERTALDLAEQLAEIEREMEM